MTMFVMTFDHAQPFLATIKNRALDSHLNMVGATLVFNKVHG